MAAKPLFNHLTVIYLPSSVPVNIPNVDMSWRFGSFSKVEQFLTTYIYSYSFIIHFDNICLNTSIFYNISINLINLHL